MQNTTSVKEGDLVEGLVYKFSPIGANVRINDSLEGLLYGSEIFKDLRIGDRINVYVKKIRDDGKIDLSLEKSGYKNFIEDASSVILTKLKDAGGSLPFSDKSSPEEIQYRFQMSKKKFKEAIGNLYKSKRIEIGDEGIRLI